MKIDQSNVPLYPQPTRGHWTNERLPTLDSILIRIRILYHRNIKSEFYKFTLISLCLTAMFFFLPVNFGPEKMLNSPLTTVEKHPDAFIITADCQSVRFNATKENIERVFPNFFNIRCFVNIPLSDPRIHNGPLLLMKRASSHQLAFIDLWTTIIPTSSGADNLQWSFIFEDDVNFNDPSRVFLLNYTSALQEMMLNPQVQLKDGFMYLGICGPSFLNDSQPLIISKTNGSLLSRRGSGLCLHASGITARRSRLFWSEIASYRSSLPDSSTLDFELRLYSQRSGNHFYIFGSNFLFPPGSGQFGIAYQDRGRFSSTLL